MKEHISASNRNCEFAFQQALSKYGEENFEWSILDTANNQEELDEKEIYWIKYYDTYNQGGYNMAVGGQFTKKEYCDLDKLSETYGGREFLIYDLEGNFIGSRISQTEFAKEIGVCVQTVNNVLSGIKNQVRGRVLIFKEDFSEQIIQEKLKKANQFLFNKEFYVFNKNDLTFVGKWTNREQCSNDIKVAKKTISRSLDLKNKNSRINYLFYYKGEIPSNYQYKEVI